MYADGLIVQLEIRGKEPRARGAEESYAMKVAPELATGAGIHRLSS
jgi:hypothetical protein